MSSEGDTQQFAIIKQPEWYPLVFYSHRHAREYPGKAERRRRRYDSVGRIANTVGKVTTGNIQWPPTGRQHETHYTQTPKEGKKTEESVDDFCMQMQTICRLPAPRESTIFQRKRVRSNVAISSINKSK